MKKAIAVVSFFALCFPLISVAHPGHGETGGYTITHYFTEPIHLLITLSVIMVAVFISRSANRKKQQKENC